MTEYISPYDPRLIRWNLQDFEWLRILRTGELPAYNKSVEFIHEGNRLIDESTVKYRDWTDEELSAIRTNEISKGKTPFDVARYMGSISKQVEIRPPDTSIVRFSKEKVSYWLSRIVFKIDDVLAFEAQHGNILDEWRKKVVSKGGKRIENPPQQALTENPLAAEAQDKLSNKKIISKPRASIVVEEGGRLRRDYPKMNKVVAKKKIDAILKDHHYCCYSRTQFNKLIKNLGFPPAPRGKKPTNKKN